MSGFNDLVMPKLGLTMTEGMIAEWNVAQGDHVKAGDVIFVVETDKVATEITAESDGEIGEIVVNAGETVPVGAVVARWTGPGAGKLAIKPETPKGNRLIATPLSRRLAREHAIDLAQVTGSGPRGRIKAVDVRRFVESHSPLDGNSTTKAAPDLQSEASTKIASNRSGETRAQVMARRMTQAKQVPHFYLSAEAEVSELLSLRARLNADEGLPRLTINHFVIAAVVRALELLPQQNRIWHDGEPVPLTGVDVGIAVSTDQGLMAPVLHNLEGCSLDEIADQAMGLVSRVRSGAVSHDDMQGGAITISNAGMFNVTYMTPIINPPQSGILGVGTVREVFRPDASGAPALKREMGLVLAADHRLHDGVSGLEFLNCIIDLLQSPYRLLRRRQPLLG